MNNLAITMQILSEKWPVVNCWIFGTGT